ncbi:MAG: hypothetical protein LBH09_00545 [Peptococcaceae bacterium]|jgi:hypothetical protein|nr:hypothetical protein [Peptococcaceae bacterium]
MRALYWLWVSFILVCLIADSAMYWVVRSRLGQGLELALDSALVSGIVEEDLIWGRQLSRRDIAEQCARDILKRNLAGPLTDNLVFQFEMKQENDRVWAEGQASVKTPSLLGAFVGRGSREITVARKQAYQGAYK